jgi:hypothetical protein
VCCCLHCSSGAPPEVREDKLAEAVRIRDLLALNTEELRSVGRALNGEYILPEAGGDLLRDGAGEKAAGRRKGRGEARRRCGEQSAFACPQLACVSAFR